jgi:riboflavin synthase
MFTGIVSAVGAVRETRRTEAGLELVFDCPYEGLVPGESVAVDGAASRSSGWCRMGSWRMIRTTIERTRFGEFTAGQRVNLERALRAGDRLGGHLVQGHVDGVGTVERVATRRCPPHRSAGPR